MIKKLRLISIFGFIILLSSCESTGVCTEPITPKLMIGFTNYDNLGNVVNVDPPKDLKIYGNKDGKDIIGENPENEFLYPNINPADNNKLIPLIFDVNRDSLKYIFRFAGDIYDTLDIKYTRKNTYVNNDCGYKSTFSNVELQYYSKNRIDSISLLTDKIDYDTEQHIQIFTK